MCRGDLGARMWAWGILTSTDLGGQDAMHPLSMFGHYRGHCTQNPCNRRGADAGIITGKNCDRDQFPLKFLRVGSRIHFPVVGDFDDGRDAIHAGG